MEGYYDMFRQCFKILSNFSPHLKALSPNTNKYYEVLRSTTKYYEVLGSTTKYYEVLRSTTKCYEVLRNWNRVRGGRDASVGKKSGALRVEGMQEGV